AGAVAADAVDARQPRAAVLRPHAEAALALIGIAGAGHRVAVGRLIAAVVVHAHGRAHRRRLRLHRSAHHRRVRAAFAGDDAGAAGVVVDGLAAALLLRAARALDLGALAGRRRVAHRRLVVGVAVVVGGAAVAGAAAEAVLAVGRLALLRSGARVAVGL